MTDTNDKIRAVFLAALMVMSVFAFSVAFTGSAAARNGKTLADGDTVFQGEEGITFGFTGQTSLTHVQSGVPLSEGDIPVDQELGLYTTDGQTGSSGVSVQKPRVTKLEVNLPSGGGVDGGSVSTQDADDLRVLVNFNYAVAENVSITVEDANGLDITNQVVNESKPWMNSPFNEIPTTGGNISIDLSQEDAGEYTIIAEGSGDLDFGDAVRSTTVTLTTDTDLSLSLGQDTVTQGDDVTYTVGGGTDSDTHVVTIAKSDWRPGITASEAQRIFRNAGDTVEVGVANDTDEWARGNTTNLVKSEVTHAYAVVEIDGTTGVGSIESRLLDDTSVDVELFIASDPSSAIAGGSADDDATLTVEEGTATLSSPTGSYIVGAETDITGSATSSDRVAIYVRDSGNWQLLDLDGNPNTATQRSVAVDADDEFEVEDIRLNRGDGGGNDILAFTGTYRIGVIDAADANQDATPGPDDSITTQVFSRGISSSYTIRVVDSELTASFSTINGQVAPVTSGETDLTGTAEGETRVAYVFVDKRGNINADTVTVDDDGTFEQEDIVVSQLISGSGDFTAGQVTAAVIALGRDGVAGDGDVPNAGSASGDGLPELTTLLTNLQGQSLSGSQVLANLRAETVDDTASDDLIVTQSFRLAEGSTSITSVYPSGNRMSGVNQIEQGETMVIEGRTNLEPRDNTISVEVLQEDTPMALVSTEEWGTNGVWTVEIDTSDIETGTYSIESDDGQGNTDVVELEIVTERQVEPEPEPGASPTPRVVTEVRTRTVQGPSPEPRTVVVTQTPSGQPGFGVAVALVALLAAAMLALRRRD